MPAGGYDLEGALSTWRTLPKVVEPSGGRPDLQPRGGSPLKAVRLHDVLDLRVEDVPEPACPEDGAILKIRRASVCNGSDAALFSGRRDRRIAYPWMKLPWTLGHECAGEIVEVGRNVKGLKPGDRVASLKYGGAFAEYEDIAPDRLVRIPDSMPYDEATFVEPLWTTFRYARDNVHEGEAVVVCGLGPSGCLMLQHVAALGAGAICAVDLVGNRVEMARGLGATLAVNASECEPAATILREFGQADVFIDATGWDVYDFGLKLLKPGGRVVCYGVPDSGVHYNGTMAFFKAITFHRGFHASIQESIGAAMKLVADDKIKLGAFTTHHFPLDGVPAAVRLVLHHPEHAIGVVIDVS